MTEVAHRIRAWNDAGKRVAVATVLDVKRSAPFPPGTKMAIADSGEVVGSVSGGCVEGAVAAAAADVLADKMPRLLHFGIADDEAWEVGLPCGGEIDVFVEPAAHPGFLDDVVAGARSALVTVVRSDGGPLGAHILIRADGRREGTLGDDRLDAAAVRHADELLWAERSELREEPGAVLFIDVTAPAPRLVLFGAVEVARPLCRIARAAGWRPYVVDPRSQFATAERFPDAEQVIPAWPDEAVRRLGGIDRATYVAVLTHDPKIDDAALGLALRSEASFVGAMGSRRAQAKRRERLLAAGFDEADLERVSAPIGLDLGALTAEETALSIMAEVVAMRHGREGGRLTRASGRIHEVQS